MLVETAFIGGLVYLLWKGGKGGKAAPAKTKGGTTPSKTKWPQESPPAPPAPPASPPLSPDDKAEVQRQEAQHGAETTKFQAQLADARSKAGKDKYAQQDINKKAAARQKALDDWKRDIEAAKAGNQ